MILIKKKDSIFKCKQDWRISYVWSYLRIYYWKRVAMRWLLRKRASNSLSSLNFCFHNIFFCASLLYWHYGFMLSLGWKKVTLANYSWLCALSLSCTVLDWEIKIGSSTEGKRKKESIISIQIKEQLKKKTPTTTKNTSVPFREERHWETLGWKPIVVVGTTASFGWSLSCIVT